MTNFCILLAAYIIGDAICYVHGHSSMFYGAKKDYEKRIIEKLRKEDD